MMENDLKVLEEKAVALGASATKPVKVNTIRTGAWTRMKCQFGCANYGQTLCCPPYTPDYAFMQNFLKDYEWSLLVQYKRVLTEEDKKNWLAADKEITNGLLHILVRLETAAFLMNHYKAFALKAGRCRLCDVCNLKRCAHPDMARPSAEACGIDVFALANDNGFDARVYTGPVKEITVYGLLLVE